jgi:hypothetical protein
VDKPRILAPSFRVGVREGAGKMGQYHLYYLRGFALVGSDDIEAPDDRAAVRIAKQRGAGLAVEIWNSQKRVRVVAPAKTASAPPEPVAQRG